MSRDAEQKEALRLSELEAMRAVEEEFQKKRAREKANIRHQLRLYSLGENGGDVIGYTTGQYTSLPIEWKSNGVIVFLDISIILSVMRNLYSH